MCFLVTLRRTEHSIDYVEGCGGKRLRMVEALLTKADVVHSADSNFMRFFRDVWAPHFGVQMSDEDLAFTMMLVSESRIVRNKRVFRG